MKQKYFPTEEELATLPESKTCNTCNEEKARKNFSLQYRDRNRCWAVIAKCKRCEALEHRKARAARAEKRILSYLAPIAAAKKLIEQNPYILAELIQKHRTEYIPLLEKERAAMLKRRARLTELALKHRGIY